MRMFQFQAKAKHSSLQLKANCIAAQRCLRHFFKLIWESPTTLRGRKLSPSLTLLSVQNSNRMASRSTVITSFSNVFCQLLQYSRQHPSFSAHWATLLTKLTWRIQHFFKGLTLEWTNPESPESEDKRPPDRSLESNLDLSYVLFINRGSHVVLFCISIHFK